MKWNVLIVEDDSAMRVYLKKVLSESNLDIGVLHEAVDGKVGLEILKNHPIDILIVDLYMPVMDGMEMLEIVNSHPEYKKIPAIIVSTENDEKRIDAIEKKGLSFVYKPFTKHLLNEKIAKIMGEEK